MQIYRGIQPWTARNEQNERFVLLPTAIDLICGPEKQRPPNVRG